MSRKMRECFSCEGDGMAAITPDDASGTCRVCGGGGKVAEDETVSPPPAAETPTRSLLIEAARRLAWFGQNEPCTDENADYCCDELRPTVPHTWCRTCLERIVAEAAIAAVPPPADETWEPKAQQVIDEMRIASEACDEANGTSDYNMRLVALALISREFLRRLPSAPAKDTPKCARCFGTGYIPSETCFDCVDCQDICPVCKGKNTPALAPETPETRKD